MFLRIPLQKQPGLIVQRLLYYSHAAGSRTTGISIFGIDIGLAIGDEPILRIIAFITPGNAITGTRIRVSSCVPVILGMDWISGDKPSDTCIVAAMPEQYPASVGTFPYRSAPCSRPALGAPGSESGKAMGEQWCCLGIAIGDVVARTAGIYLFGTQIVAVELFHQNLRKANSTALRLLVTALMPLPTVTLAQLIFSIELFRQCLEITL